MKQNLKFVLAFVLSSSSSLWTGDSVSAQEFKASMVIEAIDGGDRSEMLIAKSYIEGAAQAFTVANAEADITSGNPLFCLPHDVALHGDMLVQAIRISMRENGDNHPAMAALWGMQKMFPCD